MKTSDKGAKARPEESQKRFTRLRPVEGRNPPVGEELKQIADSMVKQMVNNLNENVLLDNPSVSSSVPQDHSLLVAPHVLKKETVTALLREPLRVQQIADRWASGSPKKVREFEAIGTLLPQLREQAQLENETISKARVSGAFSDVPDSEILALYEIPALPDSD